MKNTCFRTKPAVTEIKARSRGKHLLHLMRDAACLNESQLCTEYLSKKQNLDKRTTVKMRKRLEHKAGHHRNGVMGAKGERSLVFHVKPCREDTKI
jgi:hypothetical protein